MTSGKVRELEVKTLLIHGGNDGVVPVAASVSLSKEFRNLGYKKFRSLASVGYV